MVDAYTYTDGNSMVTFKTRTQLYDYMVEKGEMVLEGDDAPKFKAHVDKRAAKNEAKAVALKAKIEEA